MRMESARHLHDPAQRAIHHLCDLCEWDHRGRTDGAPVRRGHQRRDGTLACGQAAGDLRAGRPGLRGGGHQLQLWQHPQRDRPRVGGGRRPSLACDRGRRACRSVRLRPDGRRRSVPRPWGDRRHRGRRRRGAGAERSGAAAPPGMSARFSWPRRPLHPA